MHVVLPVEGDLEESGAEQVDGEHWPNSAKVRTPFHRLDVVEWLLGLRQCRVLDRLL